MKRLVLHHLLTLLAVWAFANDGWATTAAPFDDAAASEDNVYLPVSPDAGKAGRPDRGESPATAAPVGVAPPARPVSPRDPAHGRGAGLGFRPLLYLLMTLRR